VEWLIQVAVAVMACWLTFWLGRRHERDSEAKRIKQMALLLADALERDLLAISALAEQFENMEKLTRIGFRFEPDATYIDAITHEIHLFGPGAEFVIGFHQTVRRFKADIDQMNEVIRSEPNVPDFTGIDAARPVIKMLDEKATEVRLYVTQLRRWANN